MNTEELQELAWSAEDAGKTVYIYKHETQEDVITCVEVDDEPYENDFLDVELEPYDFYAEGQWRE